MAKLRGWSTTANSNNASPPNGWPENMAPSAVNNTARQGMASVAEWYRDAGWVEYDVATYVSATQFTVPSDRTADYTQGRRAKAVLTGSVIYGTITGAVFSSVTTVTVNWDGSGALDNTLSSAQLSILTTSHQVEASDVLIYNKQTDNYTLQGSDNGKVVEINAATGKNVTLPQNSTEALPAGFHCVVRQMGVGQVTLVTQGSDTLGVAAGNKTRAQYSPIFVDLTVSGTPNAWAACGDTTT